MAGADYAHLRLTDRVAPGVSVLLVGINPGVRSALTGHHFAGYSNRFWRLLHEAGLAESRNEARKLIKGGGGRLNDKPIAGDTVMVGEADLDASGTLKLSAGRKRHVGSLLAGTGDLRALRILAEEIL